VIPVRSSLTGSSEFVLECLLLTKRALGDRCNTVSPVGLVLRNPVPMLWEVHENVVREIRRIIAHDGSFQGHGIVCELIKKLDSKTFVLEKA